MVGTEQSVKGADHEFEGVRLWSRSIGHSHEKIEVVEGEKRDRNLETPVPDRARIGLADVLFLEFRSSAKPEPPRETSSPDGAAQDAAKPAVES